MINAIQIRGARVHNLKNIDVDVPLNKIVGIAGVSGSGKTTLILESLVPALAAKTSGAALPAHVKDVQAVGIGQVKLIDATPIGINVRSTVATYAGVHDELRKLYAKSPDAKEHGYKASDFSYNTGSLRCPGCDGTGVVSLDVQFLPDVNIPCPDCRGSRYARAAYGVKLMNKAGENASLPELMDMDVNSAIEFCADRKTVSQKLGILKQLGLGYLTLDRSASTLSTGERQRMQLARAVRNRTTGVLYVLDEPSIGLHPSNIEGLRGVMHDLIADGNSIVLVDHDTEILRDADWLIEMGPGAGENGGTILTQGTVEQVAQSPASRIGPFLADLHTLSARTRTPEAELFALGTITLRTRAIHTVKPLEVRLPKGRLIAVTGARDAFHLWHHDRAFEQPAADVLPALPLPLPRLRLHGAAQPEHCGRDPALLPPVRRAGAGAGRGAVRL